ncbi:MAG: hypothetical protein LC632_05800 [Xanthomonadaceae bacterium]|nr:hypothetical protein [Xanthomonadaceae bacterium]
MNLEPARRVAETLLYDGFNIYPYRRAQTTRQRRWSFGGLYPRGYSVWAPEGVSYAQQMQCLVDGPPDTVVEVCVRCLQAIERDPGHQREAIERELQIVPFTLAQACDEPLRQRFVFDAARETQPLRDGDGRVVCVQVRTRRLITGEVIIQAQRLSEHCYRLTVRAENHSPFDPSEPWTEDSAALYSLGAVHTVVVVRNGRFVSLIDPPAKLRLHAAECVNRGCFPVLVGDRDACDTLLASPTILPDYPELIWSRTQ